MTSNLSPQHVTRNLRVIYTEKERLELGSKLAEALQTVEQIADDLKSVKADFAARKAAADAKITDLGGKVANGYHVTEVRCELRYDTPEAGKKTLFRLDTGEAVETTDMTSADKQAILPLADPNGDASTVKTVLDSDPETGAVKVPADQDPEND